MKEIDTACSEFSTQIKNPATCKRLHCGMQESHVLRRPQNSGTNFNFAAGRLNFWPARDQGRHEGATASPCASSMLPERRFWPAALLPFNGRAAGSCKEFISILQLVHKFNGYEGSYICRLLCSSSAR